MKKTKAERVIAHLLATGASELPSRSRKYRTFSHPKPGRLYFVGKCGALRAGASLTDSVSLSDSPAIRAL